jgi:prepilin-type processing-associated H-X9-DG protein
MYPPPPAATQDGRNGLAVASVICGSIGVLCLPLGIVGIILGIIALTRSKTGRGLAIAGIVTGAIGLLIMPSILLPSLNRAREAANRIKCAANLRTIGQALLTYSNRDPRTGAYPPDLATLARNSTMLKPDTFVCPSSNDNDASGPNWQQSIVAGSGFCSYVYYYDKNRSNSGAPADFVVAYEAMADHDGDGANFLFADGRVEWMSKATATVAIQQLEAHQNPPRVRP